MNYIINVERISDGKSFAKSEPVSDPQELAGILKIMGKPSMFGTPDFRIILNTAEG